MNQGPIAQFISDVKILHGEYTEYYNNLACPDTRLWPDYARGNTQGRLTLAREFTNDLGKLLSKLAPNLPYYDDL